MDWVFLGTVVALCGVGLIFIWSAASGVRSDGLVHGDRTMLRQAQWLVISILVAGAVLLIDYELFRKHAYAIYSLGLASLVFVLVFGAQVRGATRWIRIAGFQIQPSEFVKIAVVLALARFLMYRRSQRTFSGIIAPFVITLVPVGLILIQPDMGTSLVFIPALFAMLYAAGARVRHLALYAGAGLAMAPVLWFFKMNEMQRGRILSFIDPQKDAMDTGFHIIQSIIAIGSGGVTGKGLGSGTQNLLNLVPAAETDFIFSVIAEEWGLLGGLMVLALFFILFTRGIDIAAKTREPFGRLVVVGCLAIIAFQVVVNIGMTMRLCPITGLTLPFVSYGGSSLLSSSIMAALILNVGMRYKQVVAPDDFGGLE